MTTKKPAFLLLFLLISFGSVSAVLFTPALPQISQFFQVTDNQTQLTVTLFLVGYALGQLLYGPLANAYGRKKALYVGIWLEIISCLICILASVLHAFYLLVAARLFMALGASVGLKMSFTLVSDCYDQQQGQRIISHLMMAFAITPGLGIALGGVLTEHFGWQSCFVALALYGIILLALTMHLTETATQLDKSALQFNNIGKKYLKKIKNKPFMCSSILMGTGTAFVYIFAALAPFLAMNVMHVSPAAYGLWNLCPPIGIILGSQLAARFSTKLPALHAIWLGLSIILIGTLVMLLAFIFHQLNAAYLFLPLALTYVGMSFIFSNASSLAMQSATDKSSASAMMNFVNMGIATLCVLILGWIPSQTSLVLPLSFMLLIIVGLFFSLCYVDEFL